jgi:hypothetical protein
LVHFKALDLYFVPTTSTLVTVQEIIRACLTILATSIQTVM